MKSYYFLCLFRADKSASGLAFRIPVLWRDLVKKQKFFKLIINKSLYDKVLKSGENAQYKENIIIVPEWLGFKLSLVLFVPLILLYIFVFKRIKGFHVSLGGFYFIKFIRLLSVVFNKKTLIHTSIGSKSLEMATGGDLNSKYYKLHYNALSEVDKVDCLYSPEGFPQFAHKMIQSPGSFSWKYSVDQIKEFKNTVFNKEKAILFCGSIIPQKNFKLAFEAYKEYCKSGDVESLAVFYLIAPDINKELCDEIITFNASSAGKIVIGGYSDLDLLLRKSCVFLSLQDYDNYPSQSLIEAMSFGCTVIATNFGETSKLVKVEYGNILINKDISELARSFRKIISSDLIVNHDNIDFILSNHSLDFYSDFFVKNIVGS